MAHGSIGPYQIEHRLATGGMAEVFVAKRIGPHGFSKRVALKRILPQYLRDHDFVAMFIDEARLAAQLEHPNVVQVFDFGEADGQLFLAMELVDGSNVNRLLRAVSQRGNAVPLDVALHIASQASHALAYAHRAIDDSGRPIGFVHRDVSPANLLLTRTGHVKLTDFGIARVRDRDPRTDEGHVRGKLGYMSPEQVLGRDLDGRSDVFTLATVFAEMLLAEPLFGTGTDIEVLLRIRDVNLDVLHQSSELIPQDVRRLLLRALSKRPEERPTSDALADACDEIRRRRGMAHGIERLATLLRQLELISTRPEEDELEPAGTPVSGLVDTSSSRAGTDRLVRQIGTTSPAIYRVRLGDGREAGPMSYPRLVQLITTGVIHAATPVSKESGAFSDATALPELARFVTSPALQWRPGEIERASRGGDLEKAELLKVFYRIVAEQHTGVLHLWDGVRRKKVYFVEGKPDFVASTDRRELLGEYLVDHGRCLRMEVEMALALLPRYGGRLGDALVGLGVLRPMELVRAITEQVRARLLEAFTWRRGQWAFIDGEESREETYPLAYDPYELLRDAAKQAHTAELEAGLAPSWERVLVKNPIPPIPLRVFRLPETWHRLLDEVRGDRTFAATLASETFMGRSDAEDVYRAFFLGLSCELTLAT